MFWSRRPENRLENWDGRRRSSRDGGPALPRVWNRQVSIKIGLLVATTIFLVILLYSNGIPFPHRIGSVPAHDLRARVAFAVPNQSFAANQLEAGYPVGSLEEGGGESPPLDRYAVNAVLVKRGQKVDGPKLILLFAEHRAYAASLDWTDRVAQLLSTSLILALLAALLAVYVGRFQPGLAASPLQVARVCVLVVCCLGLALFLGRPPWDAAIVPLTFTAMVLAIVYNPPFALLASFCITIVLTIGEGAGFERMLTHVGGLSAAVLLLGPIRSRSRPVKVGIYAGVAYFTLTVATGLLPEQPVRLFLIDGLRYFCWSVLAGFILCGSLPAVERCFGVMTDATLLELADGSHPLMQELVRRAPGTYTHSMTVATLAEAAAEAAGANTLLCRVGSYFHDIGKMMKPHYFVENQSGENRHDRLEPALSTLVIMGHIKDGVALAKQYRLPQPIIELIQQHHGTTLVEYFYREALRINEECGHGGELEYAFRYPGPKPRTREAGILMLADASESASRALPVPNPNSLRKLVHDLFMKRLLDGQFDECDVTLAEWRRIEESISKSLIAVFHARIRYKEVS